MSADLPFEIVRKGYNPEQVRTEIARLNSALQDELTRRRDAEAAAARAEAQQDGTADREAIAKALVEAERAAEAIRSEAREEAVAIREAAEAESAKIVAEGESERDARLAEAGRLEVAIAEAREALTLLLNVVNGDLASAEDSFTEALTDALPESDFDADEPALSDDSASAGDDDEDGDDVDAAGSDDDETSAEVAADMGTEDTHSDEDSETAGGSFFNI